jgi:redox-sensitive bicupin YhaK (pirin superfamily)
MTKTKNVQKVIAPPATHMVGDGFRVHNFFPGTEEIDMVRMSPFILLDYNSLVEWPACETPRGVGVHPHRGFETVSIAYKGSVAHHDSAGNSGVIHEGDVQWMTAASGILHKEYHEKEFSRKGGAFQMVQLWVNLPADVKMSAPKYQAITKELMGKYDIPPYGGTVQVLAGSFMEVKGPANTFTPINIYNIELKKGLLLHSILTNITTPDCLLLVEALLLMRTTTLRPTTLHFLKMTGKR